MDYVKKIIEIENRDNLTELQKETHRSIEMYENSRKDSINCEEHYVLVDDIGNYVCVDCNCFFDNKAVKIELVKRYGEDFLEEEYNILKKNRALAKRGNLKLATAYHYDSGDTKYYYEQRFNN